MFLNKLTGTSIGLTAWDMFVINKPTLLTVSTIHGVVNISVLTAFTASFRISASSPVFGYKASHFGGTIPDLSSGVRFSHFLSFSPYSPAHTPVKVNWKDAVLR